MYIGSDLYTLLFVFYSVYIFIFQYMLAQVVCSYTLHYLPNL